MAEKRYDTKGVQPWQGDSRKMDSLRNLGSPAFHLRREIAVEVQFDGRGHTAFWGAGGAWGQGQTANDALAALAQDIVCLYRDLRDNIPETVASMENYRLRIMDAIVEVGRCELCGKHFKRARQGKSRPSRFCSQGCYHGWRKRNNIAAGQFAKGKKPWNKGMCGIHLSPATEFKRGQRPKSKLPLGSMRIRVEGKTGKKHVWIKTAEPNVWRLKCCLVWEEVCGPVPKGFFLHRLDGDPLNDDIVNLVLVSRATHLANHRPEFEQKRKALSGQANRERWAKYRAEKVCSPKEG